MAQKPSRYSAAPAISVPGLAIRWAKAGHEIVIGSRTQQKADDGRRGAEED